MNLDDLIITCFYWIDELMPMLTHGQRLRQRGPMPQLADSEVLTIEVVGTCLGLNQDKALFAYFHRHYQHFFLALAGVHRTIFVRQAANLRAIKERLWCHLRDRLVRHDWLVSVIDSLPIPICRFARAPWCVRFRGIASYGKDHTDRKTFYGFRLHLRLGWPGLITHLFLVPANEPDGEIAPLVLANIQGIVLGDRSYWLPSLQTALQSRGLRLHAPYRLAHSPKATAYHTPVLGRVRYLIDKFCGQLTDRCHLKRMWARDLWHLRNRLLRAVLMHTLCFWFNQQEEAPYLQLSRIVA